MKPLNWPLVCIEEGNQPGDLAISGGHGNAQEEYAMRRRIQFDTRKFSFMNRIISAWNSLPDSVVAANTVGLNAFKNRHRQILENPGSSV